MQIDASTHCWGNSVTLPLSGTVHAQVSWGDGSSSSVNKPHGATHRYKTPGTYTASVSGTVTHFGSDSIFETMCTKSVSQWGQTGLTSLSHAFTNDAELTRVPSSLPSSVTDLSFAFDRATSFNQDLSAWNTSKVTDMSWTFADARSFNQPLNSWNTTKVTTMSGMFANDPVFNQPLGSWNTAKVTNMSGIFEGDSSFNQPLGSWSLASMAPNPGRSPFVSMALMVTETKLSSANYAATLAAWASRPKPSGISFDAMRTKYPASAAAARSVLVNTYHWVIHDGGAAKPSAS